MKGRGKRNISEKTHLPAASSSTISTCKNPETGKESAVAHSNEQSQLSPRVISVNHGKPESGWPNRESKQSTIECEFSRLPLPHRSGRGKRKILEKTRRPAASSSTISTCENQVVTPAGDRTRFASVEASMLTTRPPRHPVWKEALLKEQELGCNLRLWAGM
ncbi:hypothetical protein PR048_000498 [Dryococelus australis]|uniref:Uncharacterized protein n=1 Tax=Dryococelus australis TaxID=614101 RepID=A0ABQ9IES8_9NEOP|nr:hypothetical protein PR048_000498 [Dryococelus australis]